jgi:hypothetical protein
MPPPEDPPPRFPLKERFVWLWHPHFWLTLVIVVILILIAMRVTG